MNDDKIQFYVHIDQSVYDDVEDILSSHNELTDDQGHMLRSIIRMVARRLKMDIPLRGNGDV